ncbi:hypothetical protein NUW54_g13810 [Trametes sanguinea]|uniref:Uncharacterized protein n=1 Tax=Trametes sanguinea TaxID=158606 RepID=A0ACC1MIQ9_9APHY|nr:hypothetical protein NUW54_g13810 [Trametes sanguinea]
MLLRLNGGRVLSGKARFSSGSIARTAGPSSYASAAETSTSAAARGSSVASASLPTSRIDEKKVVLGWDETKYSRYHHIWLRDHCRCPECFHPITKQRLVNTFEIPPDIKPTRVQSNPEGLEVHWPSTQPHVSLYPWSWLRYNSYDPPLSQPSNTEKILWGSKILQDPPTVTYAEAMAEDNKGLFKWLSHVDKFGFCFISGVPATPEATEELSRRIGFIRETQYGTFWDFTSDLAKGDTAYTTLALSAHTDTTYFVGHSYHSRSGNVAYHALADRSMWPPTLPSSSAHWRHRRCHPARGRLLRRLHS